MEEINMKRSTRIEWSAHLLGGLALVVAMTGCGGGDADGSAPPSMAGASSTDAHRNALEVGSAGLDAAGQALDSSGQTIPDTNYKVGTCDVTTSTCPNT